MDGITALQSLSTNKPSHYLAFEKLARGESRAGPRRSGEVRSEPQATSSGEIDVVFRKGESW